MTASTKSSGEMRVAIPSEVEDRSLLRASGILTEAFGAQVAALGGWQSDLLPRFVVDLPRIDLRWMETFDNLIPSNLRGLLLRDLDVVASITFREGLPLCWIPRDESVAAILEADSPQERRRILLERRDDILDDCELALATSEHEWAAECRSAIATLRCGHFGPAQSHASNIVDSIVQTFATVRPRALAVEKARRDFDEIPFQQVACYLTLRPLDRAFAQWWPNAADPLPDHFARHPTTHAVGHSGLFAPVNALVAVMLAASLTVQFESDELSDIRARRSHRETTGR